MMNRRRDERGAVAIIVSLFTVFVLFGISALVVDLGFARDQKQASQISSDAAALAGANVLYRTGRSTGCSVSPCFKQAVQAVEAYTAKNFPSVTSAMWSSCADANKGYVYTGTFDATYVQTNCVSFFDNSNGANSTQPTKVRVVTPTVSNPTFFGAMTGVTQVPIATSARAKLQPGQSRSCGLCLLGSVINDIGNGDVSVTGASIHTNGSFSVGPQGGVDALPAGQTITAVNGCTGPCSPAATYAPAITDPYAGVSYDPAHHDAGFPTSSGSNPCTAGPGMYTYNYTFPKTTCDLSPGLYVIDGTWQGTNKLAAHGHRRHALLHLWHREPHHCVHFPRAGRRRLRHEERRRPAQCPDGDAQLATTGGLAGYVIVYDRNNNSSMTTPGQRRHHVHGHDLCGGSSTDRPSRATRRASRSPTVQLSPRSSPAMATRRA